MSKNKTFLVSGITAFLLVGCNGSDSDNPIQVLQAKTAPTEPVVIQSNYKNQAMRSYSSNSSTDDWDTMSRIYANNQKAYQSFAFALTEAEDSGVYPDYFNLPSYSITETYSVSGNFVTYTDGERYGVFTNSWWTLGDEPSFDSKSGPWVLVARTDASGNYLTEAESTDTWVDTAVYTTKDTVNYEIDGIIYSFEAKYWTQGDQPILTKSSGLSDVEDWKSPWVYRETLSDEVELPDLGGVITPPVCDSNIEDCTDSGEDLPDGTVVIDPVVPTDPVDPDVTEPSPPPETIDVGDNGLPSDGYAFLRTVTDEQWDWLFPLRSGKFVPNGGARNNPPFAKEDGSTDVFTLSAFKNAVIEYNSWARANGYKEFLNEGSKRQQAQEFVTFWAKSSRETSGSWVGASEPWAVNDPVAGHVWKGALYWVEEVGFTTNADGTSPYVSYVDSASTYVPEPGRSYYGRGIIQLSWNYNYGAFSAWLYDNGLMQDVITERRTLLKRPDYVATNGELSILSGIWFWMTPQGAKPSSHDVMFGEMTHVSEFSQDQGLPQRNDGKLVPTSVGDTTKEDVTAYRIGTVINIVNGGIECNGAAAWHTGPIQRVSYYNAYAKYMNFNNGVDITLINSLDDQSWGAKVTTDSPETIKLSTCFAQKSYYGW